MPFLWVDSEFLSFLTLKYSFFLFVVIDVICAFAWVDPPSLSSDDDTLVHFTLLYFTALATVRLDLEAFYNHLATKVQLSLPP